MALHETKYCQRCGSSFECKMGSITQCQCYGIILPGSEKAWVEKNYTDCLCIRCLKEIQGGDGAAEVTDDAD